MLKNTVFGRGGANDVLTDRSRTAFFFHCVDLFLFLQASDGVSFLLILLLFRSEKAARGEKVLGKIFQSGRFNC